jgi:hypothetical protein
LLSLEGVLCFCGEAIVVVAVVYGENLGFLGVVSKSSNVSNSKRLSHFP